MKYAVTSPLVTIYVTCNISGKCYQDNDIFIDQAYIALIFVLDLFLEAISRRLLQQAGMLGWILHSVSTTVEF